MKDDIIVIKQISKQTGILSFKNIICKVWLGENGTTTDKIEGDLKTPLGRFNLGIVIGFHNIDEIEIDDRIEYVKITDSMYWDCQPDSKTYNRLIDIMKIDNDIMNFYNIYLKESEHLIDYPIEYEYAIEIKTNPRQVAKKGSAIFLHCYNNKPTKGCVAIEKENLINLLKLISLKTEIVILPMVM